MSPDLDARTDALFAAAEAGDWASFRSAFADDAVFKQNIGPAMTIDEALAFLPALTADGTTLAYENVRRHIADRAVTELHDAVFTKPDGREIRIDICVVLEFADDGLIVRGNEYLDPGQAAGLA